MYLTERHREKFINWWCILFYLLMLMKYWNGMFLFQLQPHLFTTRPDVFSWMMMQTGLHRWLMDNRAGCILFDIVFYAMPLLYWLAFKKSRRLAGVVAMVMLPVNWIYVQCYTLFPANSIEGFTPWLLFPVLLMCISLSSFYYVMHGLRYFFLFFFASAGLWKIVQGAVFNTDQMSGILLYQHKEYLASSNDRYSHFILWLINHPAVGYSLFLLATFLELFFFVGYFTKKYDRFLIAIFIAFLIFDVLIMRIPYWEVSPFLLTLFFSKYKAPQTTSTLLN